MACYAERFALTMPSVPCGRSFANEPAKFATSGPDCRIPRHLDTQPTIIWTPHSKLTWTPAPRPL
ncbi:hypothetical protein EGU81_27230, partial [Pseudomonas syringae pv. theae]|nr:hypothetical protein [Pseudomonas syringae pv. theae]